MTYEQAVNAQKFFASRGKDAPIDTYDGVNYFLRMGTVAENESLVRAAEDNNSDQIKC